MTGRELLRRLRVAVQDAEEPYRYSTDQLWRWIQAAYMDIQRRSQQWDFMHRRGLFLTTTAGVENYKVGDVREIADHSLYYREPGQTAQNPVTVLSYEDWSLEQQSGLRRAGPPLFLVENPDHTWRPYPAPDKVYHLYADWWLRPAEMETIDDEPIWDAEYHEILLYEVMELAASLEPETAISGSNNTQKSARATLMLTEAAKFLPGLRQALNQRYLPDIVGPESFL